MREHFTDTLFLSGLELFLTFLIRGIASILPEMADILDYVRKFSKWFVVAALVQFAFESLLSLAEKDIDRVRRLRRLF